MELVQWIVPLEDGSLAVGWAPVWADRLQAIGGLRRPVRRRGAPLVSRWLPCPLAAGSFEDRDDAEGQLSLAPFARGLLRSGALSLLLGIAADGDEARPILPPDADDVRFAGLLAELVRVTADLAEAAGVPMAGIAPSPDRRGFEVGVGALGTMTVLQLADALLLFRAALEMCAQARGVRVTSARVRLDDKTASIDGRLAHFFAEAAGRESP